MKNSIISKRLIKPILLLVTVLCFIGVATFSYAEAMVIVNSGVAEETLSKSDIEKIYTGKKSKWSDGSKIIFAGLKDGATHDSFLDTYVSKSPAKFKAYWKKMVFTGKGKPPKAFDTEEELMAYVAKTSGAIGYVSAVSGGVKQVTVSE